MSWWSKLIYKWIDVDEATEIPFINLLVLIGLVFLIPFAILTEIVKSILQIPAWIGKFTR